MTKISNYWELTLIAWLCLILQRRRNGSELVMVDVEGLGDDISAAESIWLYKLGVYLSWKDSGGGTIIEAVLSLIKDVLPSHVFSLLMKTILIFDLLNVTQLID